MSHHSDFEDEDLIEDEELEEGTEEDEDDEFLPELDIDEDGHVRPKRRRRNRDDDYDIVIPDEYE
jgi:hypothetical protein